MVDSISVWSPQTVCVCAAWSLELLCRAVSAPVTRVSTARPWVNSHRSAETRELDTRAMVVTSHHLAPAVSTRVIQRMAGRCGQILAHGRDTREICRSSGPCSSHLGEGEVGVGGLAQVTLAPVYIQPLVSIGNQWSKVSPKIENKISPWALWANLPLVIHLCWVPGLW